MGDSAFKMGIIDGNECPFLAPTNIAKENATAGIQRLGCGCVHGDLHEPGHSLNDRLDDAIEVEDGDNGANIDDHLNDLK
jgi:hypothetical protein